MPEPETELTAPSPDRDGEKKGAPGVKPSIEQDGKSGTQENDHSGVSRKDLLEKALAIIAEDLNLTGDERPSNTIANLVQLLKLDRLFKEDEEQPHEIRVVWQEKSDETFDDSAGSSHDM
jgi:hypothetical protein